MAGDTSQVYTYITEEKGLRLQERKNSKQEDYCLWSQQMYLDNNDKRVDVSFAPCDPNNTFVGSGLFFKVEMNKL